MSQQIFGHGKAGVRVSDPLRLAGSNCITQTEQCQVVNMSQLEIPGSNSRRLGGRRLHTTIHVPITLVVDSLLERQRCHLLSPIVTSIIDLEEGVAQASVFPAITN